MAATAERSANAERIRRHRAKHGRRDRKTVAAPRAPGKTQFGWLIDDGIIDMVAVQIVVSGERCPALTHNEALLATHLLVEQAKRKSNNNNAGTMSAIDLIQARLKVTRGHASSLMTKMGEKRREGEYNDR
jgi:hypothetical protein